MRRNISAALIIVLLLAGIIGYYASTWGKHPATSAPAGETGENSGDTSGSAPAPRSGGGGSGGNVSGSGGVLRLANSSVRTWRADAGELWGVLVSERYFYVAGYAPSVRYSVSGYLYGVNMDGYWVFNGSTRAFSVEGRRDGKNLAAFPAVPSVRAWDALAGAWGLPGGVRLEVVAYVEDDGVWRGWLGRDPVPPGYDGLVAVAVHVYVENGSEYLQAVARELGVYGIGIPSKGMIGGDVPGSMTLEYSWIAFPSSASVMKRHDPGNFRVFRFAVSTATYGDPYVVTADGRKLLIAHVEVVAEVPYVVNAGYEGIPRALEDAAALYMLHPAFAVAAMFAYGPNVSMGEALLLAARDFVYPLVSQHVKGVGSNTITDPAPAGFIYLHRYGGDCEIYSFAYASLLTLALGAPAVVAWDSGHAAAGLPLLSSLNVSVERAAVILRARMPLAKYTGPEVARTAIDIDGDGVNDTLLITVNTDPKQRRHENTTWMYAFWVVPPLEDANPALIHDQYFGIFTQRRPIPPAYLADAAGHLYFYRVLPPFLREPWTQLFLNTSLVSRGFVAYVRSVNSTLVPLLNRDGTPKIITKKITIQNLTNRFRLVFVFDITNRTTHDWIFSFAMLPSGATNPCDAVNYFYLNTINYNRDYYWIPHPINNSVIGAGVPKEGKVWVPVWWWGDFGVCFILAHFAKDVSVGVARFGGSSQEWSVPLVGEVSGFTWWDYASEVPGMDQLMHFKFGSDNYSCLSENGGVVEVVPVPSDLAVITGELPWWSPVDEHPNITCNK